jgi:hypothetical protein
MKQLCSCMHVLGLAGAVPFPSGCFSIRVCIWVISIVSVQSEDPVRPVSGHSHFRILTRFRHLTSKSASVPVPCPAVVDGLIDLWYHKGSLNSTKGWLFRRLVVTVTG